MRLPAAQVFSYRWKTSARRARRLNGKSIVAGTLSLGLHAIALGGLLVWSHFTPSPRNEPITNGMVELVMVEQKGAGVTSLVPEAAPPANTPSAPQPEAPTAESSEPLPPPVPPPSASTEPQQPTPPTKPVQDAPQINIGGNDDETNAIVIDGPHIIPAKIDSKFRNKEPVYPLEAVRRAEQGAVILSIRVSPDGFPSNIDIVESSGFASLDRAARDAVWDWHFLPAVQDGEPIPFDMKLRVVFHLD